MTIKKTHDFKKFIDYLLDLSLMVLMNFSITYMIIYGMKINFSPFRLAGIISMILSVFSIIFMNKLTLKILGGFLVLSLGSWSLYLYYHKALMDVLIAVNDELVVFGEWAFQLVSGNPLESTYYMGYFITLLCVLIGLITYFFTVKKLSFFMLFTLGTGVIVFEVIQEQSLSQHAFYIFTFVSLIYFFKSKYVSLKKQLDESNEDTYRAFMKTGFYIASGIFISAITLAQHYPYEAAWVQKIVEKFEQEGYYYYSTENFSVQSTGILSEDRSLGGDISPDDRVILEVKTSSPIYLKALSQAIYTGTAWTSENKESVSVEATSLKLEDTQEFLEMVQWISEEEFENLFVKETAHIQFVNLNTKTVFIPLKTESVTITSEERDLLRWGTDALTLEMPASHNFTYTAEFYNPQMAGGEFAELLQKRESGFYKEMKQLQGDSVQNIDKWIEHAERLTWYYTQLPDELPERIRELAYEITQEQDSQYDKVKALENYLAENYVYTLTPGPATEEMDFVDEFLFETQQGYCTYFASAFAILTRSLGIPARYVEGYVLPQELDLEKQVYVVTNKRAHAWVEVYFEGLGWINFEATPPYRVAESTENSTEPIEEVIEREPISPTPENNTFNFEQEHKVPIMIFVWAVGIVIIAGFFMLYRFRKYKLKKMSPKKAVCYLYKCYLELLDVQKVAMMPGETERVFAARTEELICFEAPVFTEMTEIFLKAYYSPVDITQKEKEKMMAFGEVLLKTAKIRLNRGAYILYKIKYLFL